MRRKTEEVDIEVELGEENDVDTGDKVFDHMLETLLFYMESEGSISASGDLRHHLWEDVGITLGKEIRLKLEERDMNIARFGNAVMPMDDALVLVAVDISRPYLDLELDIEEEEPGFETTLLKEFLRALSRNLEATIHVKQLSGDNGHHIIEAVFKGLGVTLGRASAEQENLRTTKGVL